MSESKKPTADGAQHGREESPRRTAQIKGNDDLQSLYRREGSSPSEEGAGVALRQYRVERDDALPLQFTGRIVGWNDVDPSVARGTSVTVYVTRSNKIVTAVHQWQRGEKKHRQRYAAGAHESAEAALEWLIEDGNGRLGRSSKEAWERACQLWPPLRGREVEVID